MERAVQTPVALHKILASLGPKIYFFTSNVKNATKKELLEEMDKEDFGIRKQRVRQKVISYLCWLEVCPDMKDTDEHLKNLTGEDEDNEVFTNTNTNTNSNNSNNSNNSGNDNDDDTAVTKKPRMIKRVIEWDKEKDESEAKNTIANLALLLGKIRGSTYAYQDKVMVSLDDDEVEGSTNSGGSGYQYQYSHSESSDENTERAMNILRNTAVAHAFEICGRNYITSEDLPILLKIVLSSANKERVSVVKAMLKAKNVSSIIAKELDTTRDVDISHMVHTGYLVAKTGISKSHLHRILKELSALDLIDIYKTITGSSHENVMVFKNDFDFVYEDAFQNLIEQTYNDSDITSDVTSDTQPDNGRQIRCFHPLFSRFPGFTVVIYGFLFLKIKLKIQSI